MDGAADHRHLGRAVPGPAGHRGRGDDHLRRRGRRRRRQHQRHRPRHRRRPAGHRRRARRRDPSPVRLQLPALPHRRDQRRRADLRRRARKAHRRNLAGRRGARAQDPRADRFGRRRRGRIGGGGRESQRQAQGL